MKNYLSFLAGKKLLATSLSLFFLGAGGLATPAFCDEAEGNGCNTATVSEVCPSGFAQNIFEADKTLAQGLFGIEGTVKATINVGIYTDNFARLIIASRLAQGLKGYGMDLDTLYTFPKQTQDKFMNIVLKYKKMTGEEYKAAQSRVINKCAQMYNDGYGDSTVDPYISKSLEPYARRWGDSWVRKMIDTGAMKELQKIYADGKKQVQADSDYKAGEKYYYGKGVPADYTAAAKLYRRAADSGHRGAQYSLGWCCEHGKGVPADYAKACKLYRQAADQGHNDAAYRLGYLCEQGKGVPADYAKACKLYRQAAGNGHDDAQYRLGLCYSRGRGVDKDDFEAFNWYRKAAEQGNADAQYRLGLCYSTGIGVAQSEAEAYKWYRKAAAQGNQDAMKALEKEQEKALEPPKPAEPQVIAQKNKTNQKVQAVPAPADTKAEEVLIAFYTSLDAGNYAKAWELLTYNSKSYIAEAVKAQLDLSLAEDNSEEAKQARQDLTTEHVRSMFAEGKNEIVVTFWKGFCEGYEKNGYTMKGLAGEKWIHSADSDRGDLCVLATDKNGTNGMRLIKSNGEWKVGLVESE